MRQVLRDVKQKILFVFSFTLSPIKCIYKQQYKGIDFLVCANLAILMMDASYVVIKNKEEKTCLYEYLNFLTKSNGQKQIACVIFFVCRCRMRKKCSDRNIIRQRTINGDRILRQEVRPSFFLSFFMCLGNRPSQFPLYLVQIS